MSPGGGGFDYAFERLDEGVRAAPEEGEAVVLGGDWTGDDPLDGRWTGAVESLTAALVCERATFERRGDALVVDAEDVVDAFAASVVDGRQRARALTAHLADEGVLPLDGGEATLGRAGEATARNAYRWGALHGALAGELGERADQVRTAVDRIEDARETPDVDVDAKLREVAQEIQALVGDRELTDDLSELDAEERERFETLRERFYFYQNLKESEHARVLRVPMRPLELLARALDATAARLRARGDRLREADASEPAPGDGAVDAAVALTGDLHGAEIADPADVSDATERLHRLVDAGNRLAVA